VKVGLFGGTFNPIHNAHLIIAEWILDYLGLAAVYFTPTAYPPHKGENKDIIEISHRIEMVRRAIENNPDFKLADFESKTSATAYSIDTVREFLKQNRKTAGNLYFIIGEDNFRMLHTWKEAVELSRLSQIVVARRSIDLPENIPNGLTPPLFVDTPRIDISASMVRDRIRMGKPVTYLIPNTVEDYINSNNIYRTT